MLQLTEPEAKKPRNLHNLHKHINYETTISYLSADLLYFNPC